MYLDLQRELASQLSLGAAKKEGHHRFVLTLDLPYSASAVPTAMLGPQSELESWCCIAHNLKLCMTYKTYIQSIILSDLTTCPQRKH